MSHVLTVDAPMPGGLVSDLLARGVGAETVYCELLAPAARRLGDRWLDDSCDFLQVTVALGRLQEVLRTLADRTALPQGASAPGTEAPGAILVTALPDDQHSLGLYIVAECFIKEGWGVQMGHPLLPGTLDDAVRDGWYDVVGISVASAERLPELRGTISRMRRASRNPALVVLVGGAAFLDDATLVRASGADDGIGDARDAARAARRALAARRAVMAQVHGA